MQKQQRNPAKKPRHIGVNFPSIVFIAFLVCLISGCATIFSGTQQDIQVKPAGATMEIYTWDGKSFASPQPTLETTVTVSRPKLRSLIVRVQKDGYCPRYWLTSPQENPVTYLNLILGGLVGLIIDGSTGANSSFSPSEFQLHVQETQGCGL